MAKRKQRKTRKSSYKGLISFLIIIGLFAGMLYVVRYYYQKDEIKIKKQKLHESMPDGFISLGIDVSHHQGPINWEQFLFAYEMDTVISFIYCKATEGIDHLDTQWENNRETLLEIEKPHGAYHFFSVTSDPEQQARHFLNYWKKEDMDLPPVLDVETSAETDAILINSMKKWLKIVENESGMRPIIYTSLSFYETKFQNDFKDYYFWIAAYSRRPECLKDERILHWQYSDNGDLPGINKKIDLNVSKISFD